jgi:hypothetical protein
MYIIYSGSPAIATSCCMLYCIGYYPGSGHFEIFPKAKEMVILTFTSWFHAVYRIPLAMASWKTYCILARAN